MSDVPAAAIEAAAEVIYLNDDLTQPNPPPWNDPWTVQHGHRDAYRDEARAAIEAAMPAIEEALREHIAQELNALAEKWRNPEFRRQQPVLAYVGLDIAARDLTADREAFNKEVARKGAAIARGGTP